MKKIFFFLLNLYKNAKRKTLTFFDLYPPKKIGSRKVIYPDETEYKTSIFSLLDAKKPCLIGRLGPNEFNIVNYILYKRCTFSDLFLYNLIYQFRKQASQNYIMRIANFNIGLFPYGDRGCLETFAGQYIEAVKNSDLLLCGGLDDFYIGTKYFLHKSHFEEVELLYAYSVISDLSFLNGKKVLIIHPFAKSLAKQFKVLNGDLKKLHTKTRYIVPETFFPSYLKAVQSSAGGLDHQAFKDWTEALEYMKQEIIKFDFEIALVGCGAYSMPLASFVKNLGRKAIVMGSDIQVLFGIKGKRWDNDFDFYNEYWIHCLPEEIPSQSKSVEGGCYW